MLIISGGACPKNLEVLSLKLSLKLRISICSTKTLGGVQTPKCMQVHNHYEPIRFDTVKSIEMNNPYQSNPIRTGTTSIWPIDKNKNIINMIYLNILILKSRVLGKQY